MNKLLSITEKNTASLTISRVQDGHRNQITYNLKITDVSGFEISDHQKWMLY